jgi:integrase
MVFLMVSKAPDGRADTMGRLYATTITRAKPREREYKLTDGAGLYLLVKPNGRKLWRLNYAYLGKQRTLSFGAWPDVGLADARDRRDEARKMIAAGLDPSHEAKLAAAREMLSEETSFKLVAEEWVTKNEREGMAEITQSKIRWLLAKAYPKIGNRPIAKITAQEVLATLRSIEATGRYESARRMRSVLSRVFRYAIATTRAEIDPARDLRGALTVPKAKLRLSAHLFVRPGELRQAEWAEFDFERNLWDIPEHKMKMRRAHRVPLSSQVIDLFEALYELTGTGRYCFPSFRSPRRPMSENTVNAALRALGFGQEEMTAHGFRAMVATLLNESGKFNPDAIERQLAHMEANAIRRAYTRGEYWDERVRMMQHWSDHLERLRDGAKVLKPNFNNRGATAVDQDSR